MFSVLRNRNFALLWIGQLISLMGDFTLGVALPFYVLQLTGSVLQTGLKFIIETIPGVLVGPVAGVFVDRWDRRKTMIVCNVLQAVTLLFLLLVHSPRLLWLVYIVAFVQAVVSLFFSPAVSAFTPLLVEEGQLIKANSLESFNDGVMRLVGPPLGGAMLTFSGLISVVLVDGASFLFAALTLFLIVMPKRQERVHEQKNISLAGLERNVWRELLGGLGVVRKSRLLTAIFVVAGVTLFGQGFVAVMFIVYVRTVLYGNALVFSLMPLAQGVGALLGTFLIERAYKTIRPAYLMAFCLVTIEIATFVFLYIPVLPLVFAMVVLIGVCVVGSYVTKQTLLQIHTTDRYRGRVFAASGTVNSLALLLAMLIATASGDKLGAVILLDWGGIFYALAGVVALVMLRHEKVIVVSAL